MDFTRSEEEDAVDALAARVLTEAATPERLTRLEASGAAYDRDLWSTLAETGLLGLGVPAAYGGSDGGLVALGLVLEHAGRTAAAVPLLATLGYGVPPLARFAADSLAADWLGRVATGRAILTGAFTEGLGDPLRPETTARPAARGGYRGYRGDAGYGDGGYGDGGYGDGGYGDGGFGEGPGVRRATGGRPRVGGGAAGGGAAGGGVGGTWDGAGEARGGWILDGTKICVPAGAIADAVLVSASVRAPSAQATTGTSAGREVGLFLVETAADGVTVLPATSSTGVPVARLELADVRVGPTALVGPPDGSPLAWTLARATAASCAVMAGVADAAVRLTATHTGTRHQFGHPLAEFQAVRQRIADAFIDSRAIRLTALEALWRLDAGLPAAREVAVAKAIAAEGGRRVVRAATHLHGGTGVDRAYPLHRHYLAAKRLELTLGTATTRLLELGRLLAAGAECGAGEMA
jgi:alkylation response protein AidB-like acyl-CoA dehydrogenase